MRRAFRVGVSLAGARVAREEKENKPGFLELERRTRDAGYNVAPGIWLSRDAFKENYALSPRRRSPNEISRGTGWIYSGDLEFAAARSRWL